MRMWAKGTAGATLLTASFVAFGTGPALADVTNGDGSILGGNQINAPISVPVDISGNSVAAVGHAVAGSRGGSAVRTTGAAGGDDRTSGRHSIGGGNQVNAPISVPVNACGNAIAVVGGSLAGCEGGAKVGGPGGYVGAGHHTSGRHSIGGGNQVNAPISAPVNICGNSAAVIGDALAGCKGGAKVANAGGGAIGGRTSGRGSIGGGNQVHAPVNAPINVCGNGAAVIGDALAGCKGGAKVGVPGGYGGYAGAGRHTSGAHSILGGNQVHAPVNAPVDVCGNAAAVIGHALGSCGADTGGYSGGDDCITPSSARMSGLPQLPVDPASLRTGAMPVAMGATPALPKLGDRGPADLLGQAMTPQSAIAPNPLDGGLGVPPVGVPPVGGPPKQLPPIKIASAATSTGSQNGALMALVLGGMFAASAGTVSVARRLGRRSSR